MGTISIADLAFERLGAIGILEELRAAAVPAFLVGGAVRDLLLDESSVPKDIDLMVAGKLASAREVLDRLGAPRINRHKNLRYILSSGLHIDVMDSTQFYGQARSVARALEYFDVSANAVAVELQTGDLLDPLCGRDLLMEGWVWLPVDRWVSVSPLEDVHVLLRAMRLVDRLGVRILNPEVASPHRSQFDHADWVELERLNGFGREEAERRYDAVMMPQVVNLAAAAAARRAA